MFTGHSKNTASPILHEFCDNYISCENVSRLPGFEQEGYLDIQLSYGPFF